MRHIIKPLLACFVVLGAVLGFGFGGAAWFGWQLNRSPIPASDALPSLPAAAEQAGALRATFLGVATVLFDDGRTAILTDGFFSRPPRAQVLFGKVAPDTAVIARALQRAGIKQLAAVVVGHSHYDHAMDAPEVARRTGAVVVGSSSTAQVARGWGLPEDRIRIANDGDTLRFGGFDVTLIRSRHIRSLVTGGEIDAPLVPPVRATEYHEGGTWSVLIRHGDKSALVQSSAGFIDGALRGRHADVVFLGIGLLGTQDRDYMRRYWQETVMEVGAARVIPIHWDDFTLPLDQPLAPLPKPLDNVDASLAFLKAQGRADKVDVKLAPVWTRIDPWAGLNK